MKRRSGWRSATAGVAACSIVLAAAPAAAKKPEHIAMEGGLGAGSALASLVWSPLKLVHAGVGMVIGGLGFLWTGGDSAVAKSLFKKSLSGDFVVTPKHLRGKKRLVFSGGGGDSGGGDGK